MELDRQLTKQAKGVPHNTLKCRRYVVFNAWYRNAEHELKTQYLLKQINPEKVAMYAGNAPGGQDDVARLMRMKVCTACSASSLRSHHP
jgi:hypothetical protein